MFRIAFLMLLKLSTDSAFWSVTSVPIRAGSQKPIRLFVPSLLKSARIATSAALLTIARAPSVSIRS